MKPGFYGPGPASATWARRKAAKLDLLADVAVETAAVFHASSATAQDRHRALYALLRAAKGFAAVVSEAPGRSRRTGT